MAKKVDKIVIPFSFDLEKDSLGKIKTALNDLSKQLVGNVGKSFSNDLPRQVNDAIKATSKAIQQTSKPVTSSKDAVNSVKNISLAFENLDKTINKVKGALEQLYDPKSAQAANEMIAETNEQLKKLYETRDKFSGLIGRQRQTGNESKLTSELNANRSRQTELNSQDKNTKAEIKELEELIIREKELVVVLEEKRQIKSDLEKLSKETGFNDIGSVDKEIAATTSLEQEVSGGTLLKQDYSSIASQLQEISNLIKGLLPNLAQVGVEAGKSFSALAANSKETEERVKNLKDAFRELIGVDISVKGLASSFKRLIKTSFEFYQSLDKALTDITIVSNMSREEVKKLTSEFIRLSAQTGMAIDDIAQASVIFFQQGLNTTEVMEMTEVTAQFAKVAGSTVEKAADQLTAAINGFQVGVEGAIDVADKLNAVAAKSAASIDEIATAMSKAASQANQAGLSMDKFYAIIATAEEVTREAPENIGTSLKTIMARMQQIKTGENTEDDTDVNQVETALNTVGIDLRDKVTGELKDLEDVLDELGPKWNMLDRNTQAYLGTIIAGTRQQSRFISIMQNWDRVLELTAVSENSAGQQALMHEKAMQGLDAAINTLTNSWQKFLTSLTDSDTFIGVLNVLSSVLNNITQGSGTLMLIGAALSLSFGKLAPILTNVGTAITKLVSGIGTYVKNVMQATKATGGFSKAIKNNEKANGKFITKYKATVKLLNEAKNAYASSERNLNSYTKALNMVVAAEQNGENGEAYLKESMAQLNTEILNVNTSEERRAELLQLLANLETVLGQTDTQRAANLNVLNQAYGETKNRVSELEGSLQQQLSTYTQVAGAAQALVATLGLGDTVMGGLIVSFTSAIALVKMLKTVGVTSFKGLIGQIAGLSAAEKTSVILTGLSLVTTLLSGLVVAFKNLDLDGSKQLSEALEGYSEALDHYNNSATKEKGLQELIDKYNTLTKKVYLTDEEQKELNDTIQAMGELTGIETTTDAMGNLAIEMNLVNIKMQEFIDNTKKGYEELKDSTDDMYKAQYKSLNGISSWGAKTLEVVSKVSGAIMSAIPGARLLGSTFLGIGTYLEKTEEKQAQRAYEASKSYYAQLIDDFSGQTSGVGKEMENQMINAYLDSDEMAKIVKKNDASKISDAVEKKNREWQKIYSSDKMKNIFQESTEELEGIVKESDQKSLATMQSEIESYYDKLIRRSGLTPEQREALKEQQAGTERALLATLGLSNLDLDEIEKTYGEKIRKAVENSNGSLLKALQEQDLFNGEEDSVNILQKLIPTEADQNELNNAFAKSGEEGYIALYAKMSELLDSGELSKKEAEAVQRSVDDLAAKIGSIQVPTWSQWGDKIQDVTKHAKEFANVLNEINENGGMTEDTMFSLIDRLDSLGSEIADFGNVDTMEKYISAIEKIKFSYDEASDSYKINAESLEYLEDVERDLAKNKMDAYKQELQINRDKAQAAVDALDVRISEVETDIQALESLKQAQSAAASAEGVTFKQRTKNVWNFAKQYLKSFKTIISGSKKTTEQDIQSLINEAGADLVAGNREIDTSGGGGKGGSDLFGIDSALSNLRETKAALEKAREKMKNKVITLDAMLRNWDTFSKVDWTRSGGNKKAAQKAVEEYIGKLNKIAEILTHIELEEKKISILQTLRAKQTGKDNIRNLLKEIELTEHLQADYVQLYNEQKAAALSAQQSLSKGFGKIISFEDDGSYKINQKAYDKLSNEQKKAFDELIDGYKEAIEGANEAYENAIKNIEDEMKYRQEAVDMYIAGENTLVEAIKTREKKILDAKLNAIDKEIDAIQKLADARAKAREEENDAEELSSLQTDLQRAMMDSSGASASQILQIQKQIKDKQQEMADNSFDDMVDDLTQQLEDEKEAEQQLFDERLEEMDWYWAEVDRIMNEGIDSVMETMELYSEEYNQLSEVQQTEMLAGWTDTFEKAVIIGKGGAREMQGIIESIRQALNSITPEELENILALTGGKLTLEDLGIVTNGTHINAYATGGMNYNSGLAWLDGTKANPEAVLNAVQTKAFLQFADDLAALRAEGAGLNSNILIDTISFNVDSMSSVEDGEIAFNAFVDKFKEIGAKTGISIRGTSNQL